MYYAFAIVKRVRAALRALRAPRLSELAWRSRACSYAAVPTRACRYTCVCVCVCIHFLQHGKKRKERRKGARRRKDCSDDAVTVAFLLQTPLFPTFFLSFLLSLLHSAVGATRIRRSGETFRGGKFRVSWGRGQNLRA